MKVGLFVHRASDPPVRPGRPALSGLDGIELMTPARADECCGFGGTFAVA
jgi:Fe-S oxidoreductase